MERRLYLIFFIWSIFIKRSWNTVSIKYIVYSINDCKIFCSNMLDFVDILDNPLNLRQCETRESSNGKWLLDFRCLKPDLFMVARKSLKSSTILEILDNPLNLRHCKTSSNGKWLLDAKCLKPKIVPLKIPLLEMVEKLNALWKFPRQFSVTQMPWKMKSLNI